MSYFGIKDITQPKPGVMINPLHPLSNGLIGYWLLNEGTGSKVFDISKNGNHGTLKNMSINTQGSGWGTSKFGCGLEFDGINNYVEISGVLVTGNFTVSAWVRPDTLNQNYARIVGKGWEEDFFFGTSKDTASKFAMSVHGNIVADIHISDDSYTNDGTWYHVVGRYNGINMALFIDSKPSGTLAWVLDPIGSTFPVRIGARSGSDGLGGYFDGSIDNVRLYNRALSEHEIYQLYKNPFCNLAQVSKQGYYTTMKAIMNQFQRTNLGADLYNGTLL